MRMIRSIILACAGLLLTACASMGPYPESPRVSLARLNPGEMTLLEQRFNLQLRIQNPNDREIPIKGMSYSLELNDREFAYGVSNRKVTVPAFGEALVDVDVVSNTLNIIRQASKLGNVQGDSLRYRLSGKLSLSNHPVSLPFEYAGEIKLTPSGDSKPL